jgi:hypothetical protein
MGLFGSGIYSQPNPIEPPPGVDMVEFYTDELQQAIREHKGAKRRRLLHLAAIVAFLLFVALSRSNGWGFWWMWGLFGGGAAAKAALEHKNQAVNALLSANDPRPINVLAVAALDRHTQTREVAIMGLERILPLIKASNADLITDEGMEALITLLGRRDPELLIALLHMLEQAGDERALSAVEKLAASHVPPGEFRAILKGEWSNWMHSSNVSWEQVREAAKECLPYLEARAEQKRISSTLLRASQDPVAPDQTLLRPAASTDSPEEQLLRPVSS